MAFAKSFLKPPLTFPAVSGDVCSFVDKLGGFPLKAHEVSLVAKQAAGTPSPSNPLPISGWDAIGISATGKNLMPDDVAYTNNYYLKSDGTISYSNAWKLSDYISIPKVENLSIDYVNFPTSAGNVVYGFFDSAKALISGVNATNHTIQVPSNACYMRLSIRKEAENIQLEIGTTTSAYKVYEGQSITVQIGSTVYGGTYDAITGILTVTHGIVTYDSNNVPFMQIGTISGDVKTRVFIRQSGVSQDVSGVPDMLCNIANPVEVNAQYQGNEGISIRVNANVNNQGFYIYNEDIQTLEDWQDYVNNNSITVAYPLATPQEIQLSPAQILTLKNNNIWADTGATSLQYIKIGR